jgi:hypothetical protein
VSNKSTTKKFPQFILQVPKHHTLHVPDQQLNNQSPLLTLQVQNHSYYMLNNIKLNVTTFQATLRIQFHFQLERLESKSSKSHFDSKREHNLLTEHVQLLQASPAKKSSFCKPVQLKRTAIASQSNQEQASPTKKQYKTVK